MEGENRRKGERESEREREGKRQTTHEMLNQPVIDGVVTDFRILENFRLKFANLVAPPTDVYAKCLVHCKAHLVP